MRLREFVSSSNYVTERPERPIFYLASPTRQPFGYVYPQIGKLIGKEREEVLEHYRPSSALKRFSSHYLSIEPTVGAYVYKVKATGAYERCHSSWLKLLEHTCMQDHEDLKRLAEGYWSGKPAPEHEDLPWEYRSSGAKVIEAL